MPDSEFMGSVTAAVMAVSFPSPDKVLTANGSAACADWVPQGWGVVQGLRDDWWPAQVCALQSAGLNVWQRG